MKSTNGLKNLRSMLCIALELIILLSLFVGCNINGGGSYKAGETADGSVSRTSEPITTAAAAQEIEKLTAEFSDRDIRDTWDDENAVNIKMNGAIVDIDGSGAEALDGNINITQSGIYILSGELNGSITVNASNIDKIQLILNGVSIQSADGPAINAVQSDKLFITLVEGKENKITDGSVYTRQDADSEPNAAIFSKDDVTVNGNGSLTVSGNYQHGIVSKDDLIIYGASLNVTAVGTALKGRDEFAAKNAKLTLNSGTNGIDSNNDTDEDKGNIIIESSSIFINSDGDGLQATRAMQLTDSDITVKSGGGAKSEAISSENSQTSAKGIKAGVSLRIDGGVYSLDCIDDSIHSNGSVYLASGTINAASADDGIHADASVSIFSGDITVSESYEGIEGSTITIYGGNINITASDDGLNAAGGADGSGMGGMMKHGMDNFMAQGAADTWINIIGGSLYINSGGDGIDSNGMLYVSGGTTFIDGPINDGNSALDYQTGAQITGGTFVAAGSSGMAEDFTSASGQCAVIVYYSSEQSAGTPAAVFDKSGMLVLAYAPQKKYSSIIISSPTLQQSSYTLRSGGTITSEAGNYTENNAEYSGGVDYVELEFSSTLLNVGNGGIGGGKDQFGGGKAWNGQGGGKQPPDNLPPDSALPPDNLPPAA